MSRAPWLGGRSGETVAFGSTLRRDNGAVGSSNVFARPDGYVAPVDARQQHALPSEPTCSSCTESYGLRADLGRARADAVALGRTEGMAETLALRTQLATAVTALQRSRSTRDDAVTELVVDVALGLCAELAPAAAAIDRRGLVQLVHKALAEAGNRTPAATGNRDLVLRMCADDVAVMASQLPGGITCEVGADLSHGEVFVEAPRLVVDGRWAPRLAALREPLLALVRAAEPAFELATDATEESDDGT